MELSRRSLLRAAGGAAMLAVLPNATKSLVHASENSARSIQLIVTKELAAPDGFEREVLHVNGTYPGPIVRGKVGELLEINVYNKTSLPTTMHWHGMNQRGTWKYDGVPGVTQAPIPPGRKWQAKFRGEPGGTFWYHSHQMHGNVYGDGQYGPLIIDVPGRYPAAKMDETVLVINDWLHMSGDELFQQLTQSESPSAPDSQGTGCAPWVTALINGKGRYPGGPKVELTVVPVERNRPMLLRVINAGSNYDLDFSIDDHVLEVLAVDGRPIVPVKAAAITVEIGARYDVLVRPTGDGSHWIRVGNRQVGQGGLAILRYSGSVNKDPKSSVGEPRFPVLRTSQLRSSSPVHLENDDIVIMPLTLSGTMHPYQWAIENQRGIEGDRLTVRTGDQVRMLLSNPSTMDHPMHLHGHGFYVLGDPANPNLIDPPKRDVVTVKRGEVLAVQFTADNPGVWMFHCHIDPHMTAGMARLLAYEGFEGQPDLTFGPPRLGDM